MRQKVGVHFVRQSDEGDMSAMRKSVGLLWLGDSE